MADIKKVKVLKRIFFSEESGYGVFLVSIKGTRGQTSMVGNLFDVNEGDFLEVEGDTVRHPKYGEQLKVRTFKSIPPEDKDGIIKYLRGRYDGIGPKIAERIVETFGDQVFDVLKNDPDRLREVKGVKKKAVEAVKQSSEDNTIVRELTVKLTAYGIGAETIYKLYKEFGGDVFGILEHNPYSLIERVRGVGFRTADAIALGFGLPRDDVNRIDAALQFLLSHYEQQNGDLYVEEAELTERGAGLLDVNTDAVADRIQSLVERNELVREELPERVVLSYKNFAIESMIAKKLFALAGETGDDPGDEPAVTVNFDAIAEQTSVTLTEEQKTAVTAAVSRRVTIITGGPGTGKTTIIRAIIEALEKEDKSVLIAAPTGRAAKRIEEAAFFQASTIHRMLKISPETGKFVHNEENPLPADVVIVDEFSMVDVFLFYSLLKAISGHTRLIIIGDKDQLPSVGPGNVLRDVIHCEYFDIIYLNRNFRQTEESLIIENAYRINGGEPLIFKPYADDLDFVYIRVDTETRALEKVSGILEYHKKDYHFNSPDFQVLVPMYRGEAGIDAVNHRIQERFNPEPVILKKEKAAYKRYDKVMQLKNNYQKEVFNGEQGIIADYDPKKKVLHVDFDGQDKEYGASELDELTLSYAVSVHKAQGSEYDMLILVMLPSHSIMLNRELFYTAVTRARRRLFLISADAVVGRAVSNSAPSERKTLLPRRLDDVFTGKI